MGGWTDLHGLLPATQANVFCSRDRPQNRGLPVKGRGLPGVCPRFAQGFAQGLPKGLPSNLGQGARVFPRVLAVLTDLIMDASEASWRACRAMQILRGTLPRLNQTGEGFLLTFVVGGLLHRHSQPARRLAWPPPPPGRLAAGPPPTSPPAAGGGFRGDSGGIRGDSRGFEGGSRGIRGIRGAAREGNPQGK